MAYVLGFNDSRVQIIKKNHKEDCVEACEEMFIAAGWLKVGMWWEGLIECLSEMQGTAPWLTLCN